MKKNGKIGAIISTTIILTAALTFMATTAFYAFVLKVQPGTAFVGSRKIAEAIDIIDKYYYYETDKDKLVDNAIETMIDSLGDPYTIYMDTQEYQEFSQFISGTYAGIGAVVLWDDELKAVTVVRPFDNSPAQNAGIVKGDKILKIDGQELSGTDLDGAVAKMKGEKGTSVILTILKADTGEETDISVIRDNIQIPSVDSQMRGEIGYIAISMFDMHTGDEFKEHLESMLGQGAQAIILDLRDNGGGLMSSVVSVANQLLNEGEMIFYTQNKAGKQVEHRSYGGGIDIPIVALINENTASASELLAGALRDNKSTPLVGKNTFGKGVVQMTHPLADGSVVKLTVEKYFTPNGLDINNKGIKPDYEIELETTEDEQYQKAVEIIAHTDSDLKH